MDAASSGRAEKILTTPANLLACAHGLFPGLTAHALGLAKRLLLPEAAQGDAIRGRDAAVLRTKRVKALTSLGRTAAREFNEGPVPA